MKRPCILIPAHNRRDLTLGCLAELRRGGDLFGCDVVVIDDASSDGTGEAVGRKFPEVTVLQGTGNLFWTGGIALGMVGAKTRGITGPLVWLNDDCRPRPGAIATLAAYVSANPEAIAGPTCIDAATGTTVPSAFVGRRVATARPGEIVGVDGLSGFCVAVGSEAALKLGVPDASHFPHYAGDTAYTLRASRAGHSVVILGDAVVALTHHEPNGISERVQQGGDFQQVFQATNSPYRLRTLFALQRLKYGAVVGTGFAIARTIAWMAQFVAAKLRMHG